MFIDTHCHLTDGYCDGVDNNEIINRAVDAGVGVMICPTADPADIPAALKLADAHKNTGIIKNRGTVFPFPCC